MRVVTAKPRPYAIRILEHSEIDRFFDAVHGPTLADRTHNKAIEEALREVAASRAVMIGDREVRYPPSRLRRGRLRASARQPSRAVTCLPSRSSRLVRSSTEVGLRCCRRYGETAFACGVFA